MELVLIMYDYRKLSVSISGDPTKPSLVLLHSLWLSGSMFDQLVEDLKGDFQIFSFDIFCHGSSFDPDIEILDLNLTALSCLKKLDELGVVYYNVLGQSMGGDIALRMAIAQPSRVKSLALFGTSCSPAPTERLDGMFSWINEINDRGFDEGDRVRAVTSLLGPSMREGQKGVEAFSLVQSQVSKVGREVVPAMRGVFGRGGICERLEAVNAPALVVTGSEDISRNPAMGRELASKLPNAVFHELSDCGHTPILEQHSACISELREFWLKTATISNEN